MQSAMERGLKFYIALAAGLVSVAFLISGLCVPSHMVFELKPFARVVLQSGNLANWTAESLHLDQETFERVRDNYQEYLTSNKRGGGDSDDSDEGEESSDSSDEADIRGLNTMNDTDTAGEAGTGEYTPLLDSSSSSEDGEDSSDSVEMTLEDRLQGVPIDQTVRLGLFGSKVCSVSQNNEEICESVPVITGLEYVKEAAAFAERELTMPFWNNVRMESLFALVAAVGGVLLLLATQRPCCDIEQTPLYLGAVSFFAAGILAFVPVIRIAMISGDFRESLEAEMNVTTELGMPWAVLIHAFGGAFALVALVALILGSRMTKRLYHMLSTGPRGESKAQNGNDVMLHHVSTGGSLSTNGYYDSNKDRALIVNA